MKFQWQLCINNTFNRYWCGAGGTYDAQSLVAAVSGVGFSLGGALLTLVLKIDIMEGASDPFAFLVMLAAIIIVFLATAWYLRKSWVTHSENSNVCTSISGAPRK